MTDTAQKTEIQKFKDTVEELRHPERGCPWNRDQTHGSLKRYLIEELYETLEAIDAIDELENDAEKKTFQASLNTNGDTEQNQPKDLKAYYADLEEELGDMLLQILLHSRIAEEKGYFDFEAVAKNCNDKMIKRHPHVFAKVQDEVKTAEEVDTHWEAAKKKEKAKRKSIFEGIPMEMPALARSWKISKKAVRESFEWDREEQLWAQLASEVEEFKEVIEAQKAKGSDPYKDGFTSEAEKFEAELELGDILFTVVNIARWNKIDPEDALRKTNDKFVRRFNKMVDIAKESGNALKAYKSTELEELWQQAKRILAN